MGYLIEEGIVTKRKKEKFLTRILSNQNLERFNLFTNIFHSLFLRFLTYVYTFVLMFLSFKIMFKLFVFGEINLEELNIIFAYVILSLLMGILFLGVKICLNRHEKHHDFD